MYTHTSGRATILPVRKDKMALSSRKQGQQQQIKGSTYVEIPNNDRVSSDGIVEGATVPPETEDCLARNIDGSTVTTKQHWRSVDKNEAIKDGISPMEVEVGGSAASSIEVETIAFRHWKKSSYAVRCVPPTWEEEIQTRRNALVTSGASSHNICTHACQQHPRDDGQSMCCCQILSGFLCGNQYVRAKRLGNMVVLREMLDEEEASTSLIDEDDSPKKKKDNPTVRSTRIVWILGPYWPFLCLVTYPLVYGISSLTLLVAIPRQRSSIILLWALCTAALLYNLFNVSCRDPGILRRHSEPPSDHGWRWNSDTLSYIPRGAVYDPDCGCVIEDYDHVCPWTGTAIGKRNMPAFQGFVAMILVCMVMDILLLTGALE